MEIEKVASLIHVIRGQRVMLDVDLALLYGVPTKSLNLAVHRNAIRFPPDFMFQLEVSEYENLRFQIETSSWGGRRYLPRAFTEHGISMLASVLRSDRAALVNISIIRAFVKLGRAITIDASLATRMEKAELALEALEAEQGEQAVAIHEVLAAFRRLTEDGSG